jgi:lysophospholipid acyltransferase (LPLAT)-like uncharacterized protein
MGPILASALVRTLRRLLRWTSVNECAVLDLHRAKRPYVHAFYHDQLLMMTYSYLGQAHGRRLVVLSSRHRDGEYVSRTLERFGHQMVRGSTGRGGVAGLKEMVRHLRNGRDVALATDGPRGPRHHVQMGAIEAARLGRAPIVPVAFAASGKKTLRSWDAFQIPLPFAKAVIVYGDPIEVPFDASRQGMEMKRRALQDALDGLTGEAEALARGDRKETAAGHTPRVAR